MPLVDRRTNSVVLRIVYDGPPDAGKTTNLQRLCERLSLSRRVAVDGPGHEHTQLFDWLDVAGGPIGGHRVRCQLVTVPGQLQLAPRRRYILDSADAVVFVADSRASSASQTDAALRALARGLRARADVPLVLQANKQDLPRAQAPGDLHAALGLAARVPAVGAQAAGGTGVLETFLLAVRLAVDHVRALLVAGELGDGDPTSATELLRALEADAPEVFAALEAIARAADTVAERATPDTAGAPAPAGNAKHGASLWTASDATAPTANSVTADPSPAAKHDVAVRIAGGVTAAANHNAVVCEIVAEGSQLEMPFLGTDADPTWELTPVEPGAAVAAGARREPGPLASGGTGSDRARASGPTPPAGLEVPSDARIEAAASSAPAPPVSDSPFHLPPVDLPAGMVWPGITGRAVLATLTAQGHPVRVAPHAAAWAPTAALELACGERWSAHTSPHLAFAEPDRGWPLLLEAIRWHAKLNYLAAPGRTYALAPEGDGVRLWVITPVYRTVWAAIDEAFARGDRATAMRLTRTGLEAVDELRARGLPIVDLDHLAVDEPLRFLATPWTPRHDRLTAQLQRLLSESVL